MAATEKWRGEDLYSAAGEWLGRAFKMGEFWQISDSREAGSNLRIDGFIAWQKRRIAREKLEVYLRERGKLT